MSPGYRRPGGDIIVQAANDGSLPALTPGLDMTLAFPAESAVVLRASAETAA